MSVRIYNEPQTRQRPQSQRIVIALLAVVLSIAVLTIATVTFMGARGAFKETVPQEPERTTVTLTIVYP